MRPQIQKIGQKYNANIKIVEVPPGPPVLSTIVAEVYGPDYEQQIAIAQQIKTILETTEAIVDIDWMVEDKQVEYQLEVDNEKAMLNGVAPQKIVHALTTILREQPISTLSDASVNEPVGIVLGLDNHEKTSLDDLQNIKIKSSNGMPVPISNFLEVKHDTLQKTIFRKDGKRLVISLQIWLVHLKVPFMLF